MLSIPAAALLILNATQPSGMAALKASSFSFLMSGNEIGRITIGAHPKFTWRGVKMPRGEFCANAYTWAYNQHAPYWRIDYRDPQQQFTIGVCK